MNLFKRGRLAAIAACVLAFAPFTASAQSALLSFVSEPGDYIGAGQTLSFSGSSINSQASPDHHSLGVHVNTATHSFHLFLSAPAGQQLVPGTYAGAVRTPTLPGEPGLEFYGDGRGCNVLTGSFQILEAHFDANGAIERLHATWEQHCGGDVPALFGEVDITNPPVPAPMVMTSTIDPNASYFRKSAKEITVTGTLHCSKQAASVALGAIEVRQDFTGNNRFAYNWAPIEMSCTPAAQAWTATVRSEGSSLYRVAPAQVRVFSYATDPDSGMPVNTENVQVVNVSAK